MASVDLGLKRTCVGCAAKFYDLGKNPALCPKCGTMNDKDMVGRKRGRKAATPDADDPLLKEKSKMEARQAAAKKKPVKEIEGVDLDAFEDIEPINGEDDIEEIEEENIDDLESLDDLDDDDDDDIEDGDIGGEVLIDEIEDEEEEDDDYEEEEDEDDDESPAPRGKKKPAKKR